MPMGGAGSRFSKEQRPKPLIELQGKPFFYWATQSIVKFLSSVNIIFVVLQDHIDRFSIDQEIHNFYPSANIIIIPQVLNGAVLTCLEGVKGVNNKSPLIFNDCDHMFICKEFYNFCENNSLDGALLTFESTEPKYSFLECDEKGNVMRTVEKKAISTHAICGAYYFKDKDTFALSAENYLRECAYSEYFMSGVYNIMAKQNMKISYFRTDIHIPFGTPEELDLARKDSRIRAVE